ncbi:hypothetical protein GCM10027160_43170 [Streptomyces calidiresistens]
MVAQYVSAGPERRQARATARNAMTSLDEAVWYKGDSKEWRRLRKAIHAFESAAMIAEVPREVSDWYVKTRVAFYLQSRRSYEEFPSPEFGGGIERRYAEGLNGATEVVHYVLWHPQRARLFWRRRLKAAQKGARAAAHDAPGLLRDLDEKHRHI